MKIKIRKNLLFAFILVLAAGVSAYVFFTNNTNAVIQKSNMVSPQKVKDIMDSNKKINLVDVRRSDEYEAGHLKDSVLLTLDTIDKQAAEILPDRDQAYYVYCRTGRRSALAVEQLRQMGYSNVFDMSGGISEWDRLGFPIVK